MPHGPIQIMALTAGGGIFRSPSPIEKGHFSEVDPTIDVIQIDADVIKI